MRIKMKIFVKDVVYGFKDEVVAEESNEVITLISKFSTSGQNYNLILIQFHSKNNHFDL